MHVDFVMIFIEKIKSIYPVHERTLARLREKVVMMEVPRRHLLVEEGKLCKCAYFIEKGMTRSYWVVDGEEITTSFSCEGDIVFSMDELYYGKPSEEYVETLEDAVLYRIYLKDLLEFFHTDIGMANWGRIIHQNEYRRLHESHRDRLTLSASDRYNAFCVQFPQVSRRARLRFIASYLGITLPTLSRLRARKR